MSVRVMSWVWESSAAKGTDRLVLLAIADAASDDGANAWPSIATLCGKTGLGVRTVQRAVKTLTVLGELAVSANAGRNGVNVYRVVMHPRQSDTPVNLTPRQDDTPVTVTPHPRQIGTTPPVTLAPKPSLNHPLTIQQTSSSEPAPRADVERVCTHLADRIEANGSKRPTITKRWRDEARRLIDLDKRTEAQVMKAIDWCQNDDFWRANVLSMPRLREKYDQLRLSAERQNRERAGPQSTTDTRVRSALTLADELDRRTS